MTQESNVSPRLGQIHQGDATASSLEGSGEPMLIHIDAAQAQTQAAARAAAGTMASQAAAARIMMTAGLSGASPMRFRGHWDACSNVPDLSGSHPQEGDLWVVARAGTTELGTQNLWQPGDAAWFRDGSWVYFSRTGWAGIVRTIQDLESISQGEVTVQSGSHSGHSDESGLLAGVFRLEDDGQPELIVTDPLGFVVFRAGTPAPEPAPELSFHDQSRPPGSRPPEASDDQTQAYRPGDLWRAGNVVWKLVKSHAGFAIWKRLNAPAAPAAALFSDDLAAVYGAKRLVPGYTGPLLDVAVNINGRPKVFTLGQSPEGKLSSHDLAIASARTESPLCVVRLYDQGGHGHHAVCAGYDPLAASLRTDRCPHIGVREHDGQALISWACEPNPLQALHFPTSLNLAGGDTTVILQGAFSSTNAPPYSAYQAFSLGTDDEAGLAMTFGTGNESGRLILSHNDPFRVIAQSDLTPSISHGVIALRLQGGDQARIDMLMPNRETATVRLPDGFSSRRLVGGALGATQRMVGHSCALQLGGLIVLKRAITDAEMARMLESAAIIEAITPQLRDRLDCIGSSSMQGFNNKDGWCLPQMLFEYLQPSLIIRNWAVPGAVSGDFVTKTLTNVLADRQQVRSAYALTWLGANDVYRSIDFDTIIQNNAVIHKALREAGYRKIFILGQFHPELTARIHEAVQNGVIDADGVIDPVSAGPMSDHGDRELYSDGMHPTEAGDRLIASFVAAQLNRHLQEG